MNDDDNNMTLNSAIKCSKSDNNNNIVKMNLFMFALQGAFIQRSYQESIGKEKALLLNGLNEMKRKGKR